MSGGPCAIKGTETENRFQMSVLNKSRSSPLPGSCHVSKRAMHAIPFNLLKERKKHQENISVVSLYGEMNEKSLCWPSARCWPADSVTPINHSEPDQGIHLWGEGTAEKENRPERMAELGEGWKSERSVIHDWDWEPRSKPVRSWASVKLVFFFSSLPFGNILSRFSAVIYTAART